MSRHWFRRREGLFSKDLGWGYVPISREGWFVTGLFIAGIFVAMYLSGLHQEAEHSVRNFLLVLGLLLLAFILTAEQKVRD